MSEHDRLCPALDPDTTWELCHCTLIAKARTDEREKIAKAIEDYPALVGRLTAAQIARNGGRDE